MLLFSLLQLPLMLLLAILANWPRSLYLFSGCWLTVSLLLCFSALLVVLPICGVVLKSSLFSRDLDSLSTLTGVALNPDLLVDKACSNLVCLFHLGWVELFELLLMVLI